MTERQPIKCPRCRHALVVDVRTAAVSCSPVSHVCDVDHGSFLKRIYNLKGPYSGRAQQGAFRRGVLDFWDGKTLDDNPYPAVYERASYAKAWAVGLVMARSLDSALVHTFSGRRYNEA